MATGKQKAGAGALAGAALLAEIKGIRVMASLLALMTRPRGVRTVVIGQVRTT